MSSHHHEAFESRIQVREVADPEGGLSVELRSEGTCVASARARGDAVAQLTAILGLQRGDILALLEAALTADFLRARANVEVTPPRLIDSDPGRNGGRFVSRYLQRESENIVAGVVWYDPSSNITGPENVSALVRSKMRSEVQRKRAERPPSAWRFLVDVLDAMSS